MFKFDYFRLKERKIDPKTPASAIKAFEAEILPIEVFIYKATSIKPLDEEPYDIPGIERVLTKTNLEIGTNLLIMGILKKLIKNEEPEIALFAAESINLIEDRYNKKIEKAKKQLETDSKLEDLLNISNLYYELSLLNSEAAAIRNFYLKEAYSYIKEIELNEDTKFNIYKLYINILCDLKLYDQAIFMLDNSVSKKMEENKYQPLLLELEILFKKKDFDHIFEIFSELKKYEDKLTESEKEIVSYWLEYK